MKTTLKEHWLFVAIVTPALLLRFLPLFDYQFTYDEWSGLFRTQFNSFGELIDKGVKIDAHPAFVQVLIYYLSKAFGYTDWIIKLPFLLFSVGAIIYSYVFCLRNFSKQSAAFAAAFFSYSLVFVYYAPIARMYISGIFFSLGLLYHFSEVFFLHNTRRIHFFFIGFFALLSALNQHINALFALTVCASAFLFINRETIKPFLITCIFTILLYLPHLPVTLYQVGLGGIGFDQGGWLPVPKLSDLFEFIKIIFGTGRTYLVVFGIAFFAFILNRQRHLNKIHLWLITLFLLNFFVVYFYSILRAPVYQHSAMLFAGTGLLLAICSVFNFTKKIFFYPALGAVCAILIFKTYYKKDYLGQCVKNIFEYQFERTAELKKNYGNNLVYPVFFDADTFMKKVCFEKYGSDYKCSMTGDDEIKDMKAFGELVSQLNCNYLVLASSFPNYEAVAREHFPFLAESSITQGLRYKVYSKTKTTKAGDENILYYSNPFLAGPVKYSASLKGKKMSLEVDTTNEFPFSGTASLNEVSSREGQIILLKTEFKLQGLSVENIYACISANDSQSDSSHAYSSSSLEDFVIKNDSTAIAYTIMYCGTNYDKIKNKSKLTAFIWNRGRKKFSLTNFELSTIDFWPQKWNYWK